MKRERLLLKVLGIESMNIFGLILLISLITLIYMMQLMKSFNYMSLSELKRRARANHKLAFRVLRARRHGLLMWFILWSVLSISIFMTIYAIANLFNFVPALISGTFLLLSLVLLLPWFDWPKTSLRLAAQVSTPLDWLCTKLGLVTKKIRPLRSVSTINVEPAIKIHSRDNLLEVMESLKTNLNVKSQLEIQAAMNALVFNKQQVKEIMTPIKRVKKVGADDHLSPIFLDGLHESDRLIFPVTSRAGGNEFVGVLYLQDLQNSVKNREVASTVELAMRPEIYYLHQNSSLQQIIEVFLKSQQMLFFVVNRDGKVVGVVTIEDALKAIFPKLDMFEFNDYDNLEAVSKTFNRPKKEEE